MQHEQAVRLIEKAIGKNSPQVWGDLGCGDGFFTKTLSDLLPPGSTIHAADINLNALNAIPEKPNNITIQKHHSDIDAISFPRALLMDFFSRTSFTSLRNKAHC